MDKLDLGYFVNTCITCKHFDELHFECNKRTAMEEIPVEQTEVARDCWIEGSDKSATYWMQRAVNAEAFSKTLMELIRERPLSMQDLIYIGGEAARNNIPLDVLKTSDFKSEIVNEHDSFKGELPK